MNDAPEDTADAGTEMRFTASPLPVLTPATSVGGARAPRGLALDFADGQFTVEVWASGEGAPLTLGPYADEDVIAVWRRMAAISGLPLLLPGPDGVLQQPYPQIGRLLIGTRCERRRLAVLSGRRPRFLAKRRASTLPRRPRIHREREIIAGRTR